MGRNFKCNQAFQCHFDVRAHCRLCRSSESAGSERTFSSDWCDPAAVLLCYSSCDLSLLVVNGTWVCLSRSLSPLRLDSELWDLHLLTWSGLNLVCMCGWVVLDFLSWLRPVWERLGLVLVFRLVSRLFWPRRVSASLVFWLIRSRCCDRPCPCPLSQAAQVITPWEFDCNIMYNHAHDL